MSSGLASSTVIKVGTTEICLHGDEPEACNFVDAMQLAWHAVYKGNLGDDPWIIGGGLDEYLDALGLRPGDKVVYHGGDLRYTVERKMEDGL